MIRTAMLPIFAFALALSATAAAAQPHDGNVIRTSLFAERFGGEPVSRAALPTHVKSNVPPAFGGPTLRAEAIVSGDLVRIGDLVENAGAAADIAIFRAPDLGQTGTVPVDQVIDAVRPHQIIGLDTRGIGEVAVTRASRMITAKDIEARILRALANHAGTAEGGEPAVIFDHEVRTLHVEPTASADLRIVRLGYDPRSGRFDVSFDLPGSAAARRLSLRFTGTIAETFEALVPARAIPAGEMLKASDLTIARRPKSEFNANVVIDAAQAVGRTPRRALRPGQLLRQADLVKPELVHRNDSVTITYEVPGVTLSVTGQALEPGGPGDVINVLNVQSKKTIRASVAGPGHVTVAAATARIAANVGSSRSAR